jgi:hypothetical protein
MRENNIKGAQLLPLFEVGQISALTSSRNYDPNNATSDRTHQGNVSSSLPLPLAVDGNLETSTLLINTAPSRTQGWEIDLRNPREEKRTITSGELSATSSGGGMSINFVSNVLDNDLSTQCSFAGVNSGESYGFDITFTGTSPRVNRIQMSTGNSDTNSIDYFVTYLEGSDKPFCPARQINFSTNNALEDFPLHYSASATRVIKEPPFTIDGLAWKGLHTQSNEGHALPRIKKLKIFGTSTFNGTALFQALNVFEINYQYEDGISLEKVRVKVKSTSTNQDYRLDYSTDAINYTRGSVYHLEDNVEYDLPIPTSEKIKKIRLISSEASELFEIIPFAPVDKKVNFDFNDSILETKAWKSSRYSGKQLQGSQVNKFTTGDVSYGKTPVIQNVSRNIYLGSRVIGLGQTTSTQVDDASLLVYPGFSYVTVHEYLTVHEDLSVTRHTVRGDNINTNNNARKGFYQSFYKDFPIGSDINLRFFDPKIQTSIKPSYNIYFNAGQLQRLLHVRENDTTPGNNYVVTHLTGSNTTEIKVGGASNSVTYNASFDIFNKEDIIDNYFSGSLLTNIYDTTTVAESSGFASNVVK